MLGPGREVAGSWRQGMPAVHARGQGQVPIEPEPARRGRGRHGAIQEVTAVQVITGHVARPHDSDGDLRSAPGPGREPHARHVSIHVEEFIGRQDRPCQAGPAFDGPAFGGHAFLGEEPVVTPEVLRRAVRFLLRRRAPVGPQVGESDSRRARTAERSATGRTAPACSWTNGLLRRKRACIGRNASSRTAVDRLVSGPLNSAR